jgi:hypothetical protein
MEVTKATLDEKFGYTLETKEVEFDKDALFFVNWENLKGVEDLVLIFACMGLSFSGHHPHFETIKHLLDLSNPVKPPQGVPQQPKAEDLKMPKLKTIK